MRFVGLTLKDKGWHDFFYAAYKIGDYQPMHTQPERVIQAAKVVDFPPPSAPFSVGQKVFLTQEYYNDANTSVLEIPRYGWQVKSIVNGVATIEYQRRNLKLLMTLMVDIKYLTKEV